MINEILYNPKFSDVTHILKIDDYEAMNLTEEKIQHLYSYNEIKENHYIGQDLMTCDGNDSARRYHYGKVTPNSEWDNKPYLGPFVDWFNGGKTYILSRYAMSCINSKYNTSNLDIVYRRDIYEDLMIAKCLYKHRIFPLHINYRVA